MLDSESISFLFRPHTRSDFCSFEVFFFWEDRLSNTRKAITRKKNALANRKQKKKGKEKSSPFFDVCMFVTPPPYLKDCKLYCQTVAESIKDHLKRVEAREKELFQEDEVHLPETLHEKLAWNLHLSRDDVPTRIDSLFQKYMTDLKRIQTRVEELKKKLHHKYLRKKARLPVAAPLVPLGNSDEVTKLTKKYEKRLDYIIQEGSHAYDKLIAGYEPFLKYQTLLDLQRSKWREGIEISTTEWLEQLQGCEKKNHHPDNKMEDKKEIKKEIKEQKQAETLNLRIHYRHDRISQQEEVSVPVTSKVSLLIQHCKKRFHISLDPNQELKLFTHKGPLHNDLCFQQYESRAQRTRKTRYAQLVQGPHSFIRFLTRLMTKQSKKKKRKDKDAGLSRGCLCTMRTFDSSQNLAGMRIAKALTTVSTPL